VGSTVRGYMHEVSPGLQRLHARLIAWRCDVCSTSILVVRGPDKGPMQGGCDPVSLHFNFTSLGDASRCNCIILRRLSHLMRSTAFWRSVMWWSCVPVSCCEKERNCTTHSTQVQACATSANIPHERDHPHIQFHPRCYAC
jgi:hypothetical protein